LSPDKINELVNLYGASLAIGRDGRHRLHKRVRVLRNEELAYRQITIERPLRLRYELSSNSLAQLSESRPFQAASDLLAVFRTLIGESWDTSTDALSALREAVRAAGHTWPKSAAFERSVRKAVGVRDDAGEIQRKGNEAEPDPVLRESVQLPLDDDPQDYLRREVHPETPDAWIDDSKTKLGYEIRSALFFVARLNARFDQLRQFARVEPQRTSPSQADEDPIDGLPLLGAQDLHVIDTAADLPPGRSTNLPVSVCGAGDLVGRQGSWRLLPQGFGKAVTTLFVLHPLRGGGRGLCEWLNSREVTQRVVSTRDLLDLLVPADLVDDEEVEDLLEVVHDGRRALRAATSGFLPNAFASAETTVQGLRTEVRSAAHEARLIGDLMGPLEDPVWRAEWSYPYHIAALARRYRIATHPAERKDGLLKLGEGIARTLGILALSEIVAAGGFSNGLRKSFRSGATFGTWTTLLRRFAEETGTPRVRELTSLGEHNDPLALLKSIREFRNDSQHAHGVRASHELDADVEKLEPRVVSAINSVSWLAGTPWDWVERCEYLDESSYKLVGLRLRGSHPNWEPFERVNTTPLKPKRIYVAGTRSSAPADLWPFAAVLVCPDCRTRELFLLNQVRDDVLTLRSLEEHSVEIIERRRSGDLVDFVLGGLGSGGDG
jgi:type I restriction enzyme M protein